ncbi:hypothetical protein DMP23_47550 [Amycolatopsis sp. A1MSW2902]
MEAVALMRRKEKNPVANPFLAPEVRPSPIQAPSQQDGGRFEYEGAPMPTGAPAPANPVLRLPLWMVSPRVAPPRIPTVPLLQVVGLHGGAGATTVAGLLGQGVVDCGVGLDWLWTPSAPVLLVARTHGHGLDLVRRTGQQWASGGLNQIRILGLVLVADLPNLGAQKRPAESASRIFPVTWRLDWEEELRLNPGPPHPDRLSSRMRRIRKSVLAKAELASPHIHHQQQQARSS